MAFLLTFSGGGSATYKDAVRVASTANLALSGSTPLTIDGVTLADKARVLLKDQTTQSQNGIYEVSISGGSYSLARAKDADTDKEVLPGMIVPVAEGTLHADKIYQLLTNAPIVVGTTALVFSDVLIGLANKADRNLSNLTAPTALNQVLLGTLGAVGAPAYSFTGDTDTGLWSSGADTLNFSTNGTERMRINSSGYVGIGTNNPSAPFVINGQWVSGEGVLKINAPSTPGFGFSGLLCSINNSYKTVLYTNNTDTYLGSTGGLRFSTSGDGNMSVNIRLFISASGNVGIGTTTPAQLLDVNGGLRFQGGLTVKSIHAQAGTANVITVSVSDYYIGVDCSANAKTINLPAAATAGAGKQYVFKDESGNAATNNITIDPSGAELIDGAATYVMAVNRESVTVVCDGTGWQII